MWSISAFVMLAGSPNRAAKAGKSRGGALIKASEIYSSAARGFGSADAGAVGERE